MSFDRAFAFVVSPTIEGDYSDDAADGGNWTGGAPGKGECKGTKYGVSASQYPHLDIKALTISDSRAIFKRDYWDAARCDQFPDEIGFALFDTAINMGVHGAVKLLQAALKVAEDGIVGPNTIHAAQVSDPADTVAAFQAHRVLAYSAFRQWGNFGYGWVLRAFRVAMSAKP